MRGAEITFGTKKPVFLDMSNYTSDEELPLDLQLSRLRVAMIVKLAFKKFSNLRCKKLFF